MIQVFILRSGDGKAFNAGQPVASLRGATKVVEKLDKAFSRWEEVGYPETTDPTILNYEGCDIIAIEFGGVKPRQWSLDEDEWVLADTF